MSNTPNLFNGGIVSAQPTAPKRLGSTPGLTRADYFTGQALLALIARATVENLANARQLENIVKRAMQIGRLTVEVSNGAHEEK